MEKGSFISLTKKGCDTLNGYGVYTSPFSLAIPKGHMMMVKKNLSEIEDVETRLLMMLCRYVSTPLNAFELKERLLEENFLLSKEDYKRLNDEADALIQKGFDEKLIDITDERHIIDYTDW